MQNRYVFPLCVQLSVPADILGDPDFRSTLTLLKDLGFHGVELNLLDFDSIEPLELTRYLASFGLKLTMIATGACAKKNGLSLSSRDADVREKTVERLAKILAFAAEAECGIICGFIKGGPNENAAAAMTQMEASLREIRACPSFGKADIYLEATNHYEATLVNTVAEGLALSAAVGGGFKVLPDTYHMNIDESDFASAIVRGFGHYGNFHISDNNRYFPGFGFLDFRGIFSLLKSLGYSGTISIEGRCKGALRSDIETSAEYVRFVSAQIMRGF